MDMSISIITNFFSGLLIVRVWYTNHTSYFGHLRYIYSLDKKDAYLERSILIIS